MLDRFGPRLLGVFAGVTAGLSIMALALVHNLPAFYALSAVSGLSGFGAPPGQLLTTVPVAKWFHVNRGRALAISFAGIPLGAMLLIPVVQTLIDEAGWRTAWAVAGAFALLTIVPLSLFFMRKDPEELGLHPDGRDSPIEEIDDESGNEIETADDWTTRQVLRSPALWLILASLSMAGLVLPGTVVYRVSFWEDVGLTPSVVAFATTLDPFTVVISTLVCGFFAEKVPTRYIGAIGGLIIAASMLPMIFARDSVALLIAYNVIWGVGIGGYVTVTNLIWPNYFGRRFLGTIRGVVFPLLVGASALSAPLYAGLLSAMDDHYVWGFTSAAFVLFSALLLLAKPPRLAEVERTQPAAVAEA
ncbi:MAG TPA: MFS transporter [Dehalococcoidia bacterium]|nr:MFS transporter [Dehalococcoidia bacterium]